MKIHVMFLDFFTVSVSDGLWSIHWLLLPDMDWLEIRNLSENWVASHYSCRWDKNLPWRKDCRAYKSIVSMKERACANYFLIMISE